MIIGVNLLYLIPRVVGGTETYAVKLLSYLAPLMKNKSRMILFCSRDNAHLFPHLPKTHLVVLPTRSSNRIMRLLAEQLLLPLYCVSHQLDLLLSLGYSRPVFLPCKSITTVHDLNWYYCPEDYSFFNRLVVKYVNLISIYFSTALIAVSQHTASDLIRLFPVAAHKTHVIYHGKPVTKVVKSVQSPFPTPYLFSLLSHYPHKNIKTLIKVFKTLHQQFPQLHLVLGGTGNPLDQKSRQSELKSLPPSHLHFIPFLSDQALAQVYLHAAAFIFPSRYEGFGLPVLEAMYYGTPVVSSRAASLAEIIGKGGVLVDPLDFEAYVTATSQILLNPKFSAKLIRSGYNRAKYFNWQKCADSTYTLIKKVYANN